MLKNGPRSSSTMSWSKLPREQVTTPSLARYFVPQLFLLSVDPPLTCKGRNETYLDNAIAYAQVVMISAELIRVVPTFLKP